MRGHRCSPHECDYSVPGTVLCTGCGRRWTLVIPEDRDGTPQPGRYRWVVDPPIPVARRHRAGSPAVAD